MMKVITALTFLIMTTFSTKAQVAIIRNCHQLKGSEFQFPIVSIPTNLAVTKRINDYLQINYANRLVFKTTEEKLFDDVKYKMNQNENNGYLTGLSYEVMMNTNTLISLELHSETMAAYPDYFSEGYTFNAASGDIILMEDLCTSEGMKNLHTYLTKERMKLMKMHVKDLSEDSSYYELSADRDLTKEFTTCFQDYNEDDFYLKNDTVFFTSPRCLAHALEALEGDFSIAIPFAKMSSYLNSYGKKLLIQKSPVKESFHQRNLKRHLHGTIGKIPIVMCFTTLGSDVNGYYYYVSEGKKIEFWGTTKNGKIELTCHSDFDHTVDESINGIFQKNMFKGEWKKIEQGAATLPILAN